MHEHTFVREPIQTQWDVPRGPVLLLSFDETKDAVEMLAHGDPSSVWIFVGSLGSVLGEACSRSEVRHVIPTIMFGAEGRVRITDPKLAMDRDMRHRRLPDVAPVVVESCEPFHGSMSLGKWRCRVPGDAMGVTLVNAFQMRPWLAEALPKGVCVANFPDAMLRVDPAVISDDDLSRVPAGALPLGDGSSSDDGSSNDDDGSSSSEEEDDMLRERRKQTKAMRAASMMHTLSQQQTGGGPDDDVVRVGDSRFMQKFLPR